MTINSSSKLSDSYIILSKGYFAPQVLENSSPFKEPFQSSLNLFRDAILKYRNDDLPRYLGISNSPFWKKGIFIPNIGEITYNHRKNVTSRLLVGGTRTDEIYELIDYLKEISPEDRSRSYKSYKFLSYKFTYPSSTELLGVLHLPLLIGYQKKIETNPELSSYFTKSHNQDIDRKKPSISQQHRVHIHFYPYGLCFVHLAISVSTSQLISIDNLIPWVRDLKAASPNRAVRVTIPSDKLSFDSVEHFFDYVWDQISGRIFKNNNSQLLSTPIYDSIRIKPLQKVKETDVTEFFRTNKDLVITEENLESFQKFWLLNLAVKKVAFEELWVESKRAQNFFPSNTSQTPEPPNLYWLTAENPSEFTKKDAHYIRTYYAKMLTDVVLQQLRNQFPINLTPKEIAGLLSKSPDWRSHRATPSEYESAYGIYEGDLILPKSQSTLIVTNIWSRRKQLQLLFQWELSAVSELAYGEKLITSYYLERLAKSQKSIYVNNPIDFPEPNQSVILFLHSLIKIHRHLPPHFRKWYHILAETIGLDRRQEELRQYLNLYNLDEKFEDIKRGQAYIYRHLGTQAQSTTDLILKEFRQQAIGQGEIEKILDAIRRALKHILNSGVSINDQEIKKALDDIYQSINSSLDFSQQLELSLPIIPFLLEYKIGLNAGVDLGAVWEELIERVKKRQTKN